MKNTRAKGLEGFILTNEANLPKFSKHVTESLISVFPDCLIKQELVGEKTGDIQPIIERAKGQIYFAKILGYIQNIRQAGVKDFLGETSIVFNISDKVTFESLYLFVKLGNIQSNDNKGFEMQGNGVRFTRNDQIKLYNMIKEYELPR